MKKRGQLSLYIVVGLLVLLGLLVYLYVDREEKTEVIESAILPHEMLPVKTYVEECVESVGEEAVVRLAEQGGYLYFPDYIEKDTTAHLSPNGFTKIPYWYYQGQTRLPEFIDMEEDMSRFMNENLPNCLTNFRVFEDEFDVESLTPISTVVKISRNDVLFDVEYGLRIQKPRDPDEYFVKSFKIRLPANLHRLYEFATLILEAENEKMFLENITLDLMAMNSGIPFTGLEFSCSQKQWHLSRIKDSVQDTLVSQIPLLRFKHTNHRPFREDPSAYEELRQFSVKDIFEGRVPEHTPVDAYQYFHYFIDVTDRDFSDISVRTQYEKHWGMDIQSRPSSNGVLRSGVGEGDKEFLSFLCFQFYHFTYDVEYPILFSVRDDDSFYGEGLVLKFATPVQIIHNAPDRRDIGFNSFSLANVGFDACNTNGDEVDIRVKGRADGFTNLELGGVNLTLDCLRYRCDLGQTKSDNGIFRLRTNLPSGCRGGYLIAEKDGYQKKRTQLLSRTPFDFEMKKLQPMKLKVFKHERGTLEVPKELDDWDSVIINLENKEADFSTFVEHSLEEPGEMDFIAEDTTYVANILLYDILDEKLYGGYQTNMTITRDMLLSGDTVVLRVVEQLPKPFNLEESGDLLTYLKEEYTTYGPLLRPTVEASP